jgi:integrase
MAQYQRKLRKDIRWWYKFDYNGKTYASKCIYLSKNEAKKAENVKYEEVSNQVRNPCQKPVLSLLEAINERLDYVKTKKSTDYYLDNKRYYSYLFDAIGDIPVDQITKTQINNILLKMSQRLQKKNKDNYAVNAALRSYKALFSLVITNYDLTMRNPCVGIDFYSVIKRVKYIPSDEDINAIRNICDPEETFLIDFIMETGCRVSEALRVTGKDIGKGYVILYTRKCKNSNLTPRKVEISRELPNLKPDEKLFLRWNHRPQFLEEKVRQLNQRLWNFHNLRHRKASIWANKEKRPIYEVMNLLGHKNLSTTQNYLQLL